MHLNFSWASSDNGALPSLVTIRTRKPASVAALASFSTSVKNIMSPGAMPIISAIFVYDVGKYFGPAFFVSK